jgi:hypothetical protein
MILDRSIQPATPCPARQIGSCVHGPPKLRARREINESITLYNCNKRRRETPGSRLAADSAVPYPDLLVARRSSRHLRIYRRVARPRRRHLRAANHRRRPSAVPRSTARPNGDPGGRTSILIAKITTGPIGPSPIHALFTRFTRFCAPPSTIENVQSFYQFLQEVASTRRA